MNVNINMLQHCNATPQLRQYNDWIIEIGLLTEKQMSEAEDNQKYIIAVLHMLSEIFDAFAVDYNSFLATY